MPPTPPTPPVKCTLCNAYALKTPDPDGGRRCVGHSLDPLMVARREARAAQGRAVGEMQRGIPTEKRREALAGVVNLDTAREKHAEAKAAKEKPPALAIPLGTPEEVRAFLARVAGELMDEKPNGWAGAAASIAGAALKSMGVEIEDDEEAGEEDEAPRAFRYETTTGQPITVAGRGGGQAH